MSSGRTQRDALWARLAQVGTRKLVPRGMTIFRQEDHATCLYLVMSGLIEIHCDEANGDTLVVNILAERQLLGEIALFDGGPRSAGARAMRQAVVSVVAAPDVARILNEDAQLRAGFDGEVAARLRWISAQLAERHHLANSVRAARWLLHLDRTAFKNTGRVELSQSEFATVVGTTRETMARLLKTWRDRGLVTVERTGA
ncbi:MAG: Crp/Fnr family transcriptional regulator, partial [Pseudomonadota bacterium]